MLSSTPWVLQGPAPAFNSPNVVVPPNNPVSGAIQVVAAHPTNANVLYVGAVNGGVWRTTDATSPSPDWTPLTDTLPSQSIASLSLDPTDPTFRTLVAGTGQRSNAFDGDDEVGLYYSANGGAAWIQFNQSILQGQTFNGVAARGNVILAGSVGFDQFGDPTGGLYRSVDRGANWALISGTNGLDEGGIFDLVGDPLNNDRFYAAVEGVGVFRSEDAGATWTNVTTGTVGEITGADIATNMRIAAHGDVVYVGVVDDNGELSGIFRSSDKGANWSDMDVPLIIPNSQGQVSLSLAADPNNPNVVYIGGNGIDTSPYTASIWRGDASLPLGSQFTSIVDAGGGDTSPHAGSRYLGFDATGNLLEGDGGGIYRRSSPTGSGSWGSVVGDLAVTEVHDVAWNSVSHTALVGTQDNGTMQQPAPAGTTTWDVIGGGSGGDVAVDDVTLAASQKSIRYVSSQYLGKDIADDFTGPGDFRRQVIDANNNVISTTAIDLSGILDPQPFTPIALNAVDPHRLLLGGFIDLYESTNQGNSFTDLGSPPNAFGNIGQIVYGGFHNGVANPDLIYVVVDDTVYKRTTAGGALVATSPFSQFFFGSQVTDIAVDPNNWHVVFATDASHVYKSINAGGTWTDITGDLASLGATNFRTLAFVHGDLSDSLVLGTNSGVFVSHQSKSDNWEVVGTGLPGAPVYDLQYNAHDDVLVAGTLGRGVWTYGNASDELNPEPATDIFTLHSLPSATKRIYLDFTGNVTTGTSWNTSHNQPSIFTPPFDIDGDSLSFDAERNTIQNVWAQVSELFRPFNVDVTTEDPGIDGLVNSGGTDDQWGVRILTGGSVYDWYQPDIGAQVPTPGRVAVNSFGQTSSTGTDVPEFVFAADFAQFVGFGFNIDRILTLSTAWDAGVSLGLSNDGQFASYIDITKDAKFTDDAFVNIHYANDFGGFGRTDDYVPLAEQQNLVPYDFTATPPAQLYTLSHDIYDDFPGFVGNKYWSPTANWGPVMGNGAANLLQWGKGEYFNADNTEDDLQTIASEVGYRTDDHPDTLASADPLVVDLTASDSDTVIVTGEGVIGEHPSALVSDVDSFSFTVGGLGEAVNIDIAPFVNGAALDVLAKLYSSDGTLIATSNPLTELGAGSSTFFNTYYSFSNAGTRISDGGWRVQVDKPTVTDPYNGDVTGLVSLQPLPNGTWTQVSKLFLKPGTYYVTVEGTGKALTYLDVTDDEWLVAQQDPLAEPRTLSYDSAIHPGPVYRLLNDSAKPKTAVGYYEDAPDPNDPTKTVKKFIQASLPDDNSDYGYSNYGSLGSYNVVVKQTKGLVVGVDFDVDGGAAPQNWNSDSAGGTSSVLTDLISETGASVPYTLSITSSAGAVPAASNSFVTGEVPEHTIRLDELGGNVNASTDTLTFTWSNLDPWSFHQVYVFGNSNVTALNHITITGGNLNGVIQTFSFTQDISAGSLLVNGDAASDDPLTAHALTVLSDGNGEIKITLTGDAGIPTGLAGLAIAPLLPIGPPVPGSISGQKWNDDGNGDPDSAGNRIKDTGEQGLEGWVIYLDKNNNGDLDRETAPEQTYTLESHVPQSIPDGDLEGVKSSITFSQPGTIIDVDVELNITHTYDADVRVYLISPSGTQITLFESVGFNGDNFGKTEGSVVTNTGFDDDAAIDIDDTALAVPPFAGHFKPMEPLSTFNGEDILGTDAQNPGAWQLVVIDDAALNTGVLNSWKITVKVAGFTHYLEPFTTTDSSGNYTFSNLDPGLYYIREYITPEQAADGWENTWSPTPITVTSDGDIQNVDFGNWIPLDRLGSISGQKWYDADQDGVHDDQEHGLPGWIVYLDADNDGVRDQDALPTIYTNTTQEPILDPPVASTFSQIKIDTLGSVFDVQVTLNISHTYVGDLTAYLVSPSLKQIQLFSGVGGQLNDFNGLTLSDSATKSITQLTSADWNQGYSGTWRPSGNLSDLVGEDLAGLWTLVVSDTVAHDEGTLNSWSLAIRTGEEFRTTDENGFYEFDNLPAGTYNVREVPGNAPWVQSDNAVTEIPAATWADGAWTVTVVEEDDFNLDPPDAHRNVVDVDFGNYGPLGALQGYVYNDLNGSSSKGPGESGLAGWTVFLDSDLGDTPGELDTDIVDTTLSSDPGVAINHASPVSSKIWFGDVSSITDVDVSLKVAHVFDSDLTATLISPSGTRVKLFTGLGGSGDNFQTTVFDDVATASITTGTAPFDGTFQPMEPLSKFVGENSGGFWTLEIIDNSAANDGVLTQWSITILGDELHTVTDAQGHYAFDHLAPGSYDLAVKKVQGWTATEGPRTVTVDSSVILNENLGFQAPVLAGDYAGQGSVSLAGYVTWRKQSGQSGPGLPSDGNHDDNVNQTDYVLWRENFGTYVDDFGNSAAAAEVVLVPSKTYANIERAGDTDWFTFDAVSGTKYQFQVNRLTLDGAVLRLLDTNGTTLLGTSNESSPFIEWTAPASGTYFAEVRGSSSISSVGVYSLAIAEDPTGTSAANATPIAVPSTTTGATVPAGETDWYRFTAIAGTQYHVQAQLGTLTSATIKLVATDGVTQLASATGSAPAFDSATLGSAVYYITVTSASTGTYNLSLSALPGPSAGLSDSPTFASSLAADETGSTSSLLLSPFATSTNMSSPKALQTSNSATQINDEALLTLLNQGSNAGSGSNSADGGFAVSDTDESESCANDENLDGIDAMFELIGGTARV